MSPMQAPGGGQSLLERAEHEGEDDLERAMESTIGSERAVECSAIAVETQG